MRQQQCELQEPTSDKGTYIALGDKNTGKEEDLPSSPSSFPECLASHDKHLLSPIARQSRQESRNNNHQHSKTYPYSCCKAHGDPYPWQGLHSCRPCLPHLDNGEGKTRILFNPQTSSRELESSGEFYSSTAQKFKKSKIKSQDRRTHFLWHCNNENNDVKIGEKVKVSKEISQSLACSLTRVHLELLIRAKKHTYKLDPDKRK